MNIYLIYLSYQYKYHLKYLNFHRLLSHKYHLIHLNQFLTKQDESEDLKVLVQQDKVDDELHANQNKNYYEYIKHTLDKNKNFFFLLLLSIMIKFIY
jgi:hypothetical protein